MLSLSTGVPLSRYLRRYSYAEQISRNRVKESGKGRESDPVPACLELYWGPFSGVLCGVENAVGRRSSSFQPAVTLLDSLNRRITQGGGIPWIGFRS